MARRKSKGTKIVGVNPKNETEGIMARKSKHMKIHKGRKGKGRKGRGRKRGGKKR
jgi:hypothetical protein